MGIPQVRFITDPKDQKRAFDYVLGDLEYLKELLNTGKIEENIHRVGVEQELFLIDNACRPAPVITDFLEKSNEPLFTTELTRFILEINLEPLSLKGKCFSKMEKNLRNLIDKAKSHATKFGDLDLMMIGILPTIRKMDIELENLTPNERARAMIDAMKWLKQKDYPIHINGMDELNTTDFSDMAQGCNSSFQIHYQINPSTFASQFNFAQAIAAPVLAACTNSPILFGKRLWHETRIALFEQAVDTRSSTYHLSDSHLRVAFGEGWVENSITELFEDDLSKFKIFLEHWSGPQKKDTRLSTVS
ncbi:MAG: hypothetical protein WD098_00765 [Balneolales bacterium]